MRRADVLLLCAALGLSACGDGTRASRTPETLPSTAPREPEPVEAAPGRQAQTPESKPPPARGRGAVRLVRPVGTVPRDQLSTYEIAVDHPTGLTARLVFRIEHEEHWHTDLWSGDFEPQSTLVDAPIPADVLLGLRTGEEVTWGLEFDDGSPSVLARFDVTSSHPPLPVGPTALPGIDPISPDAYDDLGAALDVRVRRQPLHVIPEGRTSPALLLPRGPVLRSRLRWMALDLGSAAGAVRVEFVRRGERLFEGKLEAESGQVLTRLPEAVTAALDVGDEVTWTARWQGERPAISAQFRVVDDPETERLVNAMRRDARVARQNVTVRRTLESDIYLSRGLLSDALVVALLNPEGTGEPPPSAPPTAAPVLLPSPFRAAFTLATAFIPSARLTHPRSLPARAALEALARQDLQETGWYRKLLEDSVFLTPEESADSFAGEFAKPPIERRRLLRRPYRHVVQTLIGEGRHDAIWLAGALDELHARGDSPLARFAIEAAGWDSDVRFRALEAPQPAVPPPVRSRFVHARRVSEGGRPSEALDAAADLPIVDGTLFAWRVCAWRGEAAEAAGRSQEALDAWEAAIGVAETLGWADGAERAWSGAERAARKLSDDRTYLDVVQRRCAHDRERGELIPAAERLAALGQWAQERGLLEESAGILRNAREAFDSLELPTRAARVRLSLGAVHLSLGQWADALATLDAAGSVLLATGSDRDRGLVALYLGLANARMGRKENAATHYAEAERAYAAAKNVEGLAFVQANRADLLAEPHTLEQALRLYVQAISGFERAGDRRMAARARCAVGDLLLLGRNPDEAWTISRQAREDARRVGDRESEMTAAGNAAEALGRMGKTDEALAQLRTVLNDAEQMGHQPLVLEQRARIAQILLRQGHPQEALSVVRGAAATFESSFRGLGEEFGPTARARQQLWIAAGVEAAARVGDAASLLDFLERGRANVLLQGLCSKDAVLHAVVPPDLYAREELARERLDAAWSAHRRATRTRNLREVREQWRNVEEAEAAHAVLRERIDECRRRASTLVAAERVTIPRVQESLEPGDVLVLYGFGTEHVEALVITRTDARIAEPATIDAIQGVCAELDLGRPDQDGTGALQRLSELVVEPLALGADVSRVLVSPDDCLLTAPFGALFGGTQLAVVPSASIRLLPRRPEGGSGKRVLALGDPDYSDSSVSRRGGGVGWAPLAATRAEAQGVGDVVLLGSDASIGRLRELLATGERWRALHLACHGFIDRDQPARSGVALATSESDDGRLTALDVLGLSVPADLVVLSACDTGRGGIVRGEGIVGLSRAFLHAGAPRVLCSLWPVDDEATSALMLEFYRLWNPRDGTPGLRATEALRLAQDHVRAQAAWKRPYYWAGWVLWGVPE